MSEGRISILIEAINRVAPETDAAVDSLEKLRQVRLANQTVVLEEARTMNYLRQVYRMQYHTLYEFAGIMRNVGYIGTTLLNIHQAQSVAQIRLTEATENVADAQDRVNALIEKGLEDTIYYAAAVKNLGDAKDKEEEATRAAERATQDSTLAYVGVAAQIALVTLKIGEMIAMAGGLGAVAAAVAGVATTVAGPAALLALPFAAPFLESEEQKEQARQETYVQQGTAANVQAAMAAGGLGAQEAARLYGSITVNQTVYGVDAEDAANKAVKQLEAELARQVYR